MYTMTNQLKALFIIINLSRDQFSYSQGTKYLGK